LESTLKGDPEGGLTKPGSGCSVCLTFDFDAFSLWVTSFGTASPSHISRGEFGAHRGLPRILNLLARTDVRATFFVPAVVAQRYRSAVVEIHSSGHEVAVHGYHHERLVGLSRSAELDIARRSVDTLGSITGVAPVGYRAPGWELTLNSIGVLEELGFRYDSSQMADDYRPYRCRKDDRIEGTDWTPGPASDVWEVPVSWELDDFPYFVFNPRPMYSGLRDPDDVYKIWATEFGCAVAEGPDSVFTLTTHPEFIGRAPRVKMLERLIGLMSETDGVLFSSVSDFVAGLAKGRHQEGLNAAEA
jgi:peptidoglycan-N-acetylglucosamine deacetylase